MSENKIIPDSPEMSAQAYVTIRNSVISAQNKIYTAVNSAMV